MRRLIVAGLLVAALAACSKKSPTAPTPQAPTRVLAISGDLLFGDVEVGDRKSKAIRVSNTGSDVLSITGVNGPHTDVFTVTPTTATIPAGGGQEFTFFCKPLAVASYTGAVSFRSDATGGASQASIACAGVRTGPLWRYEGSGDNVFDMPGYVGKVKVIGTYGGCSSNFIVRVAGRLIVNELLGTCWSATRYEGTLVSGGGGQVTITNSSGVNWSFEEVR